MRGSGFLRGEIGGHEAIENDFGAAQLIRAGSGAVGEFCGNR